MTAHGGAAAERYGRSVRRTLPPGGSRHRFRRRCGGAGGSVEGPSSLLQAGPGRAAAVPGPVTRCCRAPPAGPAAVAMASATSGARPGASQSDDAQARRFRRRGAGAGAVPGPLWALPAMPSSSRGHRERRARAAPRRSRSARFTDPAVSMDLLRAVLQPSINEEIRGVFSKYMEFFQKAAINVRNNVGEEVDPEQLIQETCRSCLEQAKLLFSDGKKVVPRLPHEQTAPKRKGRPPGQSLSNDRGVSGMAAWKLKVSEPVRREGPKWDPSRLTETTTFVLGSRANKALGMGGTRGRLYIKHPHLFKYAADPQDKHWLAEQQHMRATGGKMAYLLIEEDIRDLAASDDYRDSVDLRLEELRPFIPPAWMTEKMQKHMETLRRGGDAAPPPSEGPPEP
ncbi:deoxynucleotidyltransferase terminal-interacting protein 1 isoform X2 [Heliangelus exortis]|uniref:deoxynucleotidyltransferase terminal-interacting protein 1 isoform X2 n=1 Tax=Heliangelus exortis TaxID=472823 RepID=UPI003A958B06